MVETNQIQSHNFKNTTPYPPYHLLTVIATGSPVHHKAMSTSHPRPWQCLHSSRVHAWVCYDIESWCLTTLSYCIDDVLWSSQSLQNRMKSHVGSSLLQFIKKHMSLGIKCNYWGTHRVYSTPNGPRSTKTPPSKTTVLETKHTST